MKRMILALLLLGISAHAEFSWYVMNGDSVAMDSVYSGAYDHLVMDHLFLRGSRDTIGVAKVLGKYSYRDGEGSWPPVAVQCQWRDVSRYYGWDTESDSSHGEEGFGELAISDADTILYVMVSAGYGWMESPPESGDTLYWEFSLVYFDSDSLDLKSWTSSSPHWELSDTLTIRYATIMGEALWIEGLKEKQPSTPVSSLPILYFDLAGHPIGSDARGLVLERGADGLWRRKLVLE